MASARPNFSLYGLGGRLYAIGGMGPEREFLASVERYVPSLDSWSAAPPLLRARAVHCAVAIGDAIYDMGGYERVAEVRVFSV
jgi:hypothetical protein